jgi:hypothetical protein
MNNTAVMHILEELPDLSNLTIIPYFMQNNYHLSQALNSNFSNDQYKLIVGQLGGELRRLLSCITNEIPEFDVSGVQFKGLLKSVKVILKHCINLIFINSIPSRSLT